MIENIIGEKSAWLWTMLQFWAITVSLYYIYKQISLNREANMLQEIVRFDEKWISKKYEECRAKVCKEYSVNKLHIGSNKGLILDFFEDLGEYHQRKIFDDNLIWEKFSYNIEHYWAMYSKHIIKCRSESRDITYYDKFEYLNTKMKKIANKKNVPYADNNEENIKIFICGETGLLNVPSSG